MLDPIILDIQSHTVGTSTSDTPLYFFPDFPLISNQHIFQIIILIPPASAPRDRLPTVAET